MKKKNIVYVSAADSPSFITGRILVVRIVRQGNVRVSRSYRCTPASRRRMLRVLEAMS